MKVQYIIVATACLSVAAAGIAGYQALRYRSLASEAQASRDELIAEITMLRSEPAPSVVFQTLLRHNAKIMPDDPPLVIAKKLTDHLHQSTSFAQPIATTSNDSLRYAQTISKEVGNLCSSLSSTLVWALQQFDIESRPVNLFSLDALAGTEPDDSHVFVETLIDGHATVLDPTFGATYSCGESDDISASAVFDCAADVRPVYISTPQPGRSLEDYYIPLSDLLASVSAPAMPDEPALQLGAPSPANSPSQ